MTFLPSLLSPFNFFFFFVVVNSFLLLLSLQQHFIIHFCTTRAAPSNLSRPVHESEIKKQKENESNRKRRNKDKI